jgi:4-amino-4-deoxy-L-arabinose transferase-like glycosyltransferase
VSSPRKLPRLFSFIMSGAFFLGVSCLLLSMSVQKELDHDEHQFIASGELLVTQFLLPYEHYPYFHMPNLAFVYAMLFRYTRCLLLAARVLSVVSALLSLAVIFCVACHVFRECHYRIRFLIAAGSVMALITNPLFIYTSGRAWNHDMPVCLTLLACVLLCHGTRQPKPSKWVFLAGVLLGTAVGTRLSFGPAIIPFVGLLWLDRCGAVDRAERTSILAFAFGVLLALLPAGSMLWEAPKQFLFGNIVYPQLNALYNREVGHGMAMTAVGKLIYLTVILRNPSTLVLILSWLYLIWWAGRAGLRTRMRDHREVAFLVILIPFLLIGSFAPTPSHYQYFYAPLPFLMLAMLYGSAARGGLSARMKGWLAIGVAAMVASSIYGLTTYRHLANLLSPGEWVPMKAHGLGGEIAARAGRGKVLTLAPIFPLEGGAEIYPEFATGPFAWRTARFVSGERRAECKMISEEDLRQFLAKEPPRAILLGFEGGLEAPFLSYAVQRGYRSLPLSNGAVLWLSPE